MLLPGVALLFGSCAAATSSVVCSLFAWLLVGVASPSGHASSVDGHDDTRVVSTNVLLTIR